MFHLHPHSLQYHFLFELFARLNCGKETNVELSIAAEVAFKNDLLFFMLINII
jgi:hypothetical protein